MGRDAWLALEAGKADDLWQLRMHPGHPLSIRRVSIHVWLELRITKRQSRIMLERTREINAGRRCAVRPATTPPSASHDMRPTLRPPDACNCARRAYTPSDLAQLSTFAITSSRVG